MGKRRFTHYPVRLLRSTRELIASGGLRRYRALLFQIYVLAALIAFSVLALFASVLATSDVTYFEFDLETTMAIQRYVPPWFGNVLEVVSWPGYGLGSVIVVGSVVVILFLYGLRWEAASALFASTFTGSVNYMIKIAIRRPRPGEDVVEVFNRLDSYSFPSGHVMFYTAFFGFLLFLSFILLKNSLRRWLLIVVNGLMVALVGLSRMYLGEHWASDVIGAYLLGSLCLIAAIQVYREGKARFFTDQPVAPAEAEDAAAAKVDPSITKLGEMTNAEDPARLRTASGDGRPARENTVPATGRRPDDHDRSRGDGKRPKRD